MFVLNRCCLDRWHHDTLHGLYAAKSKSDWESGKGGETADLERGWQYGFKKDVEMQV